MKEELISFKTAKLAKEKGFDEWCYAWYYEDKLVSYRPTKEGVPSNGVRRNHSNQFNDSHLHCSAPTQSLLQRWLREEHDLHIKMIPYKGKDPTFYQSEVDGMGTGCLVETINDDSYENILEVSLFQALKLINNDKI